MICGIFNAAAQNPEPGMGAWHPAAGSIPWAVQGWGQRDGVAGEEGSATAVGLPCTSVILHQLLWPQSPPATQTPHHNDLTSILNFGILAHVGAI